MASPDPEFWKTVSNYLWGALLVPLGLVWKRVDNSVQKEDFKEFIDRFDEHAKNDKEVQAKLFDQIRNSDQRAQDRHEKLMERLANGSNYRNS